MPTTVTTPKIAWVIFLATTALWLWQIAALFTGSPPLLVAPFAALLLDPAGLGFSGVMLLLLGTLAIIAFLASGIFLFVHLMKLRRFLLGLLMLLFLPAMGFALSFVFVWLVFSYPTNARDNADPSRQVDMARLTLEWGRLHPFPPTARDFTIRTEGNSFTRSFHGSFRDTPENIERWMQASPGIREGRKEDGVIYLKSQDGTYGTITISPDSRIVTFKVQWS